jgi:ferredoxin-NADP reductase
MEWYDDLVTVVKVQTEAEDTKRFFVKINSTDGSKLEFESGQFVELILPIDSDIKKCSRHYSIASQPSDDLIEFIINNVTGGAGTDYLFSDLVLEGQTQWRMIAPLGRFVLPQQIKKDLCFVCTGTGVGPFRSMINDLYFNRFEEIKDKNITLIFGCRSIQNILYKNEFEALSNKFSNFKYEVSLSKEKSDSYNFGYVQDVLQRLKSENYFNDIDFFVCGVNAMVSDVRKNLLELNFTNKDIHTEVYV